MGINRIGAGGMIPAVREKKINPAENTEKAVDAERRNIENDIVEVQQEKQALSSKKDISVEEKTKRRQDLQQELASLNTKLRMREAEADREEEAETKTSDLLSEKSEAEEMRDDNRTGNAESERTGNAADNEKTQYGFEHNGVEKDGIKPDGIENSVSENGPAGGNDSEKDAAIARSDVQSIITERNAMDQIKRQGTIIARIENDIVILKGEIQQDEARGLDVKEKKEELKEQEIKAQQATDSQFSAIGRTNRMMHKAQKSRQQLGQQPRQQFGLQPRQQENEALANAGRNQEEQRLIRTTNYSLEGNI